MRTDALLIEDDNDLSTLLCEFLEKFEIEVISFSAPKDAISYLREKSVDVIVLDLSLPEIDGLQVCKIIKSFSDIPIIISSARGTISDKVLGFEIGADDYLAKPYEPLELVMRIKSLTRRKQADEEQKIESGEFRMDTKKRELYFQEKALNLSTIEYEIMRYLLQNANIAISREELLEGTGRDFSQNSRTIDMHISKIRQKIEENHKEPKYIKSIWGVGYMFCV